MNQLTESISAEYKPKLALVVYASNAERDEFYLESHDIDDAGRLLEGKPLQQQTIQEMIDAFYDERQNSVSVEGIFPDNLLQFEPLPGGQYKMIWYRPEERKHLYFHQDLKIPSGEAWVPPMIYMVEKNRLHVYAHDSTNRPTEDTALLRAPFHNVGQDSVCLGSAKVEKPAKRTYQSLIKYWEDMFWRSEFTHITGDCPTFGNLNMIWLRLIKDNSILWDSLSHELKPLKKKLSHIL